MSTPVVSASTPPLPPTELSLTAVEVTFLVERPETKIRLTIKVDEGEREVVINKGQTVKWSGTLRCRAGANIVIHIHRRNRARLWVKFASVRRMVTAHPTPVIDDNKQISVELTVHESGTHGPQMSRTVADVAVARQAVEKKISIVEKLKPILRVLEVLAKIGEPLKDINPAIGFAVGGVSALLELCKMQKTCREDALDLLDQLTAFLAVERHQEVLMKRVETRRAVNVMLSLIAESTDFIREQTVVGLRGVVDDLLGSKYREKIDKVKKEFGRAKDSFDRSVELEILVAVDGIEMTTEFMFLHENLSECKNAHFRSDGDCLPGTRADLREHIEDWIDNPDEAQPNLFWLFGHAGSGKSTVANTVAKTAEDPARGHHLSCFFFKRDDTDLSNPRRLLPTLAFRFAQQHESYRAALIKLLRSPRGAGITTTADVKTQFERLFEELLVQTVDPLRLHVIVIDALDECGSAEDQKRLATYILALSRSVPWIKVFITSRNEPKIRSVFHQATGSIARNINDETHTDDDIRQYIIHQAEDLEIVLSDEEVRKLVDQAEGLFIWCTTLFDHLRGRLVTTRGAVLNQLLSGQGQFDSSKPWTQLYSLYDNVLDSAVEYQDSDVVSFMRTILSIVNVTSLNCPLSATAITSFIHVDNQHLQFSVEVAEEIAVKLHAVLYVDGAASGALRARHASFYDFLAWKARLSTRASTDARASRSANKNASTWETSGAIHRLMAYSCLRTLHKELKFNICGIETPVLNKDVPDLAARISERIPEGLQYSSRFWFTHLSPSTLSIAGIEQDVLGLLCSVKLLFLFECLSLQGYLRPVEFACLTCLKTFSQECPAIILAAEDAHRFVTAFADAMDSVPHIYLSALLWLPEESLLYGNLGLSRQTNWQVISNKKKSWDAHVWQCYHNGVTSVAFSPNGRFLAYGTDNGDVYMRDSETGAPAGEPLRGHHKAVCSVAYSPDGRVIASGSHDGTVRIWNETTGGAVFAPIEGHGDWVRCVAFSPDGSFVASGSDERTVRIWNAQTGELEGGPLRHSHCVRSVAYSPDGRYIASACEDCCVHVWDTSSHLEAMKPFQGHQGPVSSVAYSPDGCTIVSGAEDKTLRIWDVHTGEAIGEPLQGHTDKVNCVTYSPDGRFILSGSLYGTTRLWDAALRTPVGGLLRASTSEVVSVAYSADGSFIASALGDGIHVWDASTCFAGDNQSRDFASVIRTRAVYAVTYSPDGAFVASGSGDDRIHLWNAETGAPVDEPVSRHTGMGKEGSIRSVAYSPDGGFIVSGSYDDENSTVCVFDVQSGAIVSGPLSGHSHNISWVAYSPDGRSVASASWDGTVRLWDVQTSAAIGEPLRTGSQARSVAFSPDGHSLACGTGHGHLWIWDAHTKASIRDPIQAHSNSINSVVFSPDGHRIASGSDECSVKIWDAHTGEAAGIWLQEQQDWVRCVAYSPGGRFIASGLYDGEIIIWDVQSGSVSRKLRVPSAGIYSVAYSPNGRFLASGAINGKIYVHNVSNDYDDAEARWMEASSGMDMQDGWVRDGGTLLLWVPVPYREDVRTCARLVITDRSPNAEPYNIDHRSLLTRYSGSNWMNIFSGFHD